MKSHSVLGSIYPTSANDESSSGDPASGVVVPQSVVDVFVLSVKTDMVVKITAAIKSYFNDGRTVAANSLITPDMKTAAMAVLTRDVVVKGIANMLTSIAVITV